ncbi:DCC1 family protein [Pleurotus pulmonarius]
MCDCNLSFSSTSSVDTGSYKFLELPSELATLIESSISSRSTSSSSQYDGNYTRLKIKGVHGEDAVLCTPDKTYSMRSVVLSNSVLVVTRPPTDTRSGSPSFTADGIGDGSTSDPSDTVVIRDTLNEIIELAPTVPKLYKLNGLLRGREYSESSVDEDIVSTREKADGHGDKDWFSYQDALSQIQASDGELEKGLKDRRVLIVNGYLRPITPSFLTHILELMLNLMVSLSLTPSRAPVHEIASTLADEDDIPLSVTHQIMVWFGEVNLREDKWTADVKLIVREIGLGLLREHGLGSGIENGAFLEKWKTAVSDKFEDLVEMELLSGNVLLSASTLSAYGDDIMTTLQYFPASQLPTDPPARFAELFLTRTRWRTDDITPFLSDIAVNTKDRDRLLLKYARAVNDKDGIWYTARAQYT